MVVLSVKELSKRYGSEIVLSDVSFNVYGGDRIGLVGPNGAGKTSLLNIISGRVEPDSGEIFLQGSLRSGYLDQQAALQGNTTVWDEARSTFGHLLKLIEQAEVAAHDLSQADNDAERDQLGKRFDLLQLQIERRDGYRLDHKIERVLQGLGFCNTQFQQPIGQLSGGQQNRLLLAKLLLSEPDVMLLDEPSNHLDIEASQWLENHLATSNSTIIVVSHDRYLLDKVTNRTCELFQGKIDSYKGNFSSYWLQKAERVETQRRTYQRQQDDIERMEQFVRKNHYGQKHAQAEDRRKKLEHLVRIEPPREIPIPVMGFPPAQRTGDVVLRIEHLSKKFDTTLFSDLNFSVQRGEKWGILGSNGSGKTTLLRCVTGEVEPDDGQVIVGSGVRIAYFDQLLSGLNPDVDLLEAVRPAIAGSEMQQRRKVLARFGLTGETAHQTVNRLSGGQRNRALLARLAAEEANFLILDEPTNHLDLWSRNALERSLVEYDGSALIVSHDRYFLNRIVDHLLVADSDCFRVIEGNYDTYLNLLQTRSEGQSESNAETGHRAQKRSGRRKDKGLQSNRRRRFPYRKTHELEDEILQRETRLEQLHESLTLPELLRDGDRVKAVKHEIEQLKSELPILYEHWEESVDLN